jgi:hypothetical protein
MIQQPRENSPARKPSVKKAKRAKRNTTGFWIAITSWIIAFAIMSGAFNETFSLADSEPVFINIQVEKGDTLWGIAQHLSDTVFDHDYDVRYIIYIIEENNAIENSMIHPGQTLKVPLDL